MTLHTFHSDDQHQQVLLLLPWYLNQSLDLTERRRVEEHIRCCMLCRRELMHLEKLALAVKRASDLDVAAEVSFDRLRHQLKTSRSNSPSAKLSPLLNLAGQTKQNLHAWHKPFGGLSPNRWLGFAIAASLLLTMVPLSMRHDAANEFYTLSDAKSESGVNPTLRVVFRTLLPDSEIDALLAQIHCRRLDGPNSLGAYTVQMGTNKDAPSMAATLEFLRNQQNVILAEPVLN